MSEELCCNCKAMPKFAGYSICFHCLTHFRSAHRRKQSVMFGIIFCLSPGLFVVYILLIIQAYLIHELLGWVVIFGFPMFFLWLIFGQRLRLPSPLPVVSQRERFCIYCGTSIVGVKFCINCGTKVIENRHERRI